MILKDSRSPRQNATARAERACIGRILSGAFPVTVNAKQGRRARYLGVRKNLFDAQVGGGLSTGSGALGPRE